MKPIRASAVAAGLLTCTALGACSAISPAVAPVSFFVLSPPAAARSGSIGESSLGVGPVRFPGYLTRPQMARRRGHTQIEYVDHARWAEPLADHFAAVLASNVSARLDVSRTSLYPWYASSQPDYSAEVDILRFEEDDARHVHLQARWTLVQTATGRTRRGTTTVVEPMLSPDPEHAARALSRATATLGSEIATALSSFRPS